MKVIKSSKSKHYKTIDRAAVFFGEYNKKKTGKRLEWRSGIYEEDAYSPLLNKTPFKGRGWQADFICYEINGSKEKIMAAGIKLKSTGAVFGGLKIEYPPNKLKSKALIARSKPELIIAADNPRAAYSAIQLIPAAATLCREEFYDLEQSVSRFGWKIETPWPYLMHEAPESRRSLDLLVNAARIAAKASHKKILQHALFRYWTSKKICGVNYIETHYKTAVSETDNPYLHTIFSQAIVMAYGAIEELDLIIKQKHIEQGRYSAAGKQDLLNRLVKIGISKDANFFWISRTPQRSIEKEFPFSQATKADKSLFKNNDRLVSIVDAIHRAGRLRNKVSAHKFNKKTKNLTSIDVLNIQNLAKLLTLCALGLNEEYKFYVF